MAKKQRASEGESVPLAPEVSPPPVAILRPEETMPDDYEPVPAVSGHGMTRAFTEKGWVAYRCATNGQIDVLTPKRADGSLQGESKPSAAARMMAAIQDEYR